MSWRQIKTTGTRLLLVVLLCVATLVPVGRVGATNAELLLSLPISPEYLTDVNGTLFFSGNRQLWKSDGTEAGTTLVSSNVYPSYLTDLNGTLLFMHADEANGWFELWKSDGTTTGTTPVLTQMLFGQSFVAMNGYLYFFGMTTAPGQTMDLWKSDGTAAGTTRITSFDPQVGGSIAGHNKLVRMGDELYFAATDGPNGIELWKTDGTSAGTVMVTDINPGAAHASPTALINVNGTLYFDALGPGAVNAADYSLWKTDGTAAGTTMVSSAAITISDKKDAVAAAVGDILYYSARSDQVLWKSDGTSAGTMPVDASRNITTTFSPTTLASFNNQLYFNGSDGVNGRELWKTDGTPAGTTMVADFNPSGDFFPFGLTVINNDLYFANADGLWRTDGTAAGTVNIANVATVIDTVESNDIIYFAQNTGSSGAVWRLHESLPAPTNLTASSPTNSPTLSWDAVAGADHYDVYRDNVAIGSSTTTSFVDATAPEGTVSYHVVAVDGAATVSPPSNIVTVLVDKSAPALGSLTWTANPLALGGGTTLTVPVSEVGLGSSVVGGEYYIDTDPGVGNATAMTYSGSLSATFGSSLGVGIHTVGVRAEDAAGNWSVLATDYLVVFDAAGPTNVTASKKVVPQLANGDVLPGLLNDAQNDKVNFGFDVSYTTSGALNPASSLSLDYETGHACNSPHPTNCHTTTFTTTATAPYAIDWLSINGVNSSVGIFQGEGRLEVDSVVTTNPFKVQAVDGGRTTPTTGDNAVLYIYSPGANPDTAAPLYQLHVSENGNWVKIQ